MAASLDSAFTAVALCEAQAALDTREVPVGGVVVAPTGRVLVRAQTPLATPKWWRSTTLSRGCRPHRLRRR
jgi:tRNA(Arg) A34 adenosine deaminase TadA